MPGARPRCVPGGRRGCGPGARPRCVPGGRPASGRGCRRTTSSPHPRLLAAVRRAATAAAAVGGAAAAAARGTAPGATAGAAAGRAALAGGRAFSPDSARTSGGHRPRGGADVVVAHLDAGARLHADDPSSWRGVVIVTTTPDSPAERCGRSGAGRPWGRSGRRSGRRGRRCRRGCRGRRRRWRRRPSPSGRELVQVPLADALRQVAVQVDGLDAAVVSASASSVAPSRVRVKTIERGLASTIAVAASILSRKPPTTSTWWVIVVTAPALGSSSCSLGLRRCARTSRSTSPSSVADSSSRWLPSGVGRAARRRPGRSRGRTGGRPRRGRSSATSSSGSDPCSIRSCRRPGVATTTSAPPRSCLIWRS